MRIYLSMPMLGYSGETSQSQTLGHTLKAEGHEVFDPYSVDISTWEASQVVANDLAELQKCDLMIADLTRPSLGGGTFGEIYAAHRLGIPILLIAPTQSYGPWMQHHVTVWIDSLHYNPQRVLNVLQGMQLAKVCPS